MQPEAGRGGVAYCGEELQVNYCQSMRPVHLLSVKSTTPLSTSSDATVRKPSQTFADVVMMGLWNRADVGPHAMWTSKTFRHGKRDPGESYRSKILTTKQPKWPNGPN